MMGWSVQLTAPVLPLSPQVTYFVSFRKKLCLSYVIEVAVITETCKHVILPTEKYGELQHVVNWFH